MSRIPATGLILLATIVSMAPAPIRADTTASEPAVLELKNVDANETAQLLSALLEARSGGRASVVAHPAEHALVIEAPPGSRAALEEIVAELDRRGTRIWIDAVLLEIQIPVFGRRGRSPLLERLLVLTPRISSIASSHSEPDGPG